MKSRRSKCIKFMTMKPHTGVSSSTVVICYCCYYYCYCFDCYSYCCHCYYCLYSLYGYNCY